MNPGYADLCREGTLIKRANILAGIMKSCVLCPRKCHVDRTAGERGFCDLDDRIMIDSALAHHGEEPVLSGKYGAGTIFSHPATCDASIVRTTRSAISKPVRQLIPRTCHVS